jgi:hypothetical protein
MPNVLLRYYYSGRAAQTVKPCWFLLPQIARVPAARRHLGGVVLALRQNRPQNEGVPQPAGRFGPLTSHSLMADEATASKRACVNSCGVTIALTLP